MSARSAPNEDEKRQLLVYAARLLCQPHGNPSVEVSIEVTVAGNPPLHIRVDSSELVPTGQTPQIADPEQLGLLAYLTHAILSPEEWKIVNVLQAEPLTGQEIANRLNTSLPAIRNTLAGLSARDVIGNRTREGYYLINPAMIALCRVRDADSNPIVDAQ
jgi:HTH domain